MTTETAGVLIIDKPQGWTSHDVVARARRLTGIRQIGHAGTLDPMATGVLVLCLGKATRLLEYLSGQEKAYRAGVTLGVETDTYDADGQVAFTRPVPELSRAALDETLNQFRGAILQVPPAYSAIKRDGVASYQRARRGETVQLEPRPATIFQLDLLSLAGDRVDLFVRCTAGTYVRSLAHDLGTALGCGAHLHALLRSASGAFTLDRAVSLDALTTAAAAGDWPRLLLQPESAVAHLPAVEIAESEVVRLLHGQAVPAAPGAPGPTRACDRAGRLLAIVSYEPRLHGWKPLKVLATLQD